MAVVRMQGVKDAPAYGWSIGRDRVMVSPQRGRLWLGPARPGRCHQVAVGYRWGPPALVVVIRSPSVVVRLPLLPLPVAHAVRLAGDSPSGGRAWPPWLDSAP